MWRAAPLHPRVGADRLPVNRHVIVVVSRSVTGQILRFARGPRGPRVD
jgi:hypothetical protein